MTRPLEVSKAPTAFFNAATDTNGLRDYECVGKKKDETSSTLEQCLDRSMYYRGIFKAIHSVASRQIVDLCQI